MTTESQAATEKKGITFTLDDKAIANIIGVVCLLLAFFLPSDAPIIPIPGPSPGPDPTPQGFEATIKAGLDAIGNPSSKSKVARAYSDVAENAATAMDVWNPTKMKNDVKVRIASALTLEEHNLWTPFWEQLNKAMKELKLEKSDTYGHVQAYRRFVKVLE